MKTKTIYLLGCLLTVSLFFGCGPGEKQQSQEQLTPGKIAQQARQDSLQRAKIRQARKDSLKQLRQQRMESQKQLSKVGDKNTDTVADIFNPKNRNAAKAEGHYAIQVSSWRSKTKAKDLASQWQSRGFENADVVKYGNGRTGNIWFRVRLGYLFTLQEAQEVQKWLQKKYQRQSWVMYLK